MKGLVTKSTGLWYEVKVNNDVKIARLRGKFRLEDKKITNPIAVGDEVHLERNDQKLEEYVIVGIEKRKNYVIRESPRKKGHDHILASNIDQGVLIATLKMPRTSLGFIDRFLISLEAFRIQGVVIFNKEDLYDTKDLQKFETYKSVYESIGYEVFLTSFLQDLDSVKDVFLGKRSLLAGHSGSGKSTLINQLIPSASQEVSEVSTFANKGTHTTTFAELFELEKGSEIIDTPGIKELGLSDIPNEELSHYFPEMRRLLGQCRFHNCLHEMEPGCAIKDELGKSISELRYKSYLSILKSEDNRY
jgi:ribosome biogenesis GTPase